MSVALEDLTEEDVRKIVGADGECSSERQRQAVCGLIGHSRIQSTCFGYYYCGRCDAKLGDTLASVYSGAETAVVIGHKCDVCVKNAETLTWKDRLFTPDPFADNPEQNEDDDF